MVPAPESAVAPPASAPAPVPQSATALAPHSAKPTICLTAQEHALLDALLARKEAPATAGTSLDMLVDSINEKLFDLVGDTVLEFGDAGPVLVEDYEQDLRGYLQL